MRFGIQHAVGDPAWTPAILAPGAVAAFAEASEAAGFDALAFTDHPAPSAPWIDSGGEGVADPFSALGFCAAVTTRIRLLTFVLVAAYRNPFLAAHQLATLDALSAGRLVVGLGTGYLFGEFRALGADPSTRREALDEAIDVLRGAWSGECSMETDRFTARRTRVLPPVVQSPHPPLWIHGNSRFGLERAARHGQAWLGMMTHDNDVMVKTTRTAPLRDRVASTYLVDATRSPVASTRYVAPRRSPGGTPRRSRSRSPACGRCSTCAPGGTRRRVSRTSPRSARWASTGSSARAVATIRAPRRKRCNASGPRS